MDYYFFSFSFALSFLSSFTLASSNLSTDEYALLAFKNAVTSDGPLVVWSSNISMCNWIGVSCGTKHHRDRVTALNVSGFQLGGTIAPHLANLTFLQSLDISSNSFTGLIPFELSNLRRLKELNVGVNSLASEIPSWLGHLSQLRHLFLNNNTFSGTIPLSLFNISRLQTLDMGYNFLDGILPDKIANFSYLEILNLAGNKMAASIPNGMFNMPSLVEINARHNRLSGELPYNICSNNVPKLKRIYLSGNQFYGEIPANIYKCRELEDLRLPENNFSGSIPREIGNLTMLTTLSLYSNHFKGDIPKEIGYITSLKHLFLYDNNLTDMTAHVGDFGISKLFDEGEVTTHTTTLATIGYAAPEYGSEGTVSTAGDVYSYGILVLELFTQKKPTDDMFSEEMSLKDWVKEALRDDRVSEIVAPGLASREDEHECVSSILEMAMKCLAFSPGERIEMIQVRTHLHKIKAKATTAAAEANNRR